MRITDAEILDILRTRQSRVSDLVQRLRAKEGGLFGAWNRSEEAADRIEQLEREKAELVKALEAIVSGDARQVRKNDRCSHGQYGYESCEQCIDEYISAVLHKVSGATVTEG